LISGAHFRSLDWELISALWTGSTFPLFGLGAYFSRKINCLETEIKPLFLEQNRVNKTNLIPVFQKRAFLKLQKKKLSGNRNLAFFLKQNRVNKTKSIFFFKKRAFQSPFS